jgi:hypothetical protein
MGAITRGIANNILGNGAVDGTDALTGTIPATNIGNPSLANLTTFPPSVSAGIPQVAGDPPAPSEGDVWYNTNTYKLKVRGVSAPAGTWASGTSKNTATYATAASGTQTAALVTGGRIGAPTYAYQSINESWNGSAWTEVADLNTGRAGVSGAGTENTSNLVFSGLVSDPTSTTATETWNGTSWTEVNDLNNSRGYGASAGTATSALMFGGAGVPLPGQIRTFTETWNGTSWTEVGDLNASRFYLGGFGTATSALAFGGFQPPYIANTETWNGTSWTEVNDMNTTNGAFCDAGSTSAGIAAGGSPPQTAKNEAWDGTSWTEVGDLPVSISYGSGVGTSIAALAVGGQHTPSATVSADVYEWNGAADNLNVDLA